VHLERAADRRVGSLVLGRLPELEGLVDDVAVSGAVQVECSREQREPPLIGRPVVGIERPGCQVGDGLGALDEAAEDDLQGAQVGTFYWVADYPTASNFLRTVMACAAFSRDPVENSNPSQFCDRGIDAQMRRATALQATDPQRANELWAKIDREVVDAAPWVPLTNPKSVEILSARAGNYQFNPQVGSLLDQLWVRWPSRAASISNGSGAAPAGTTRAWSGQASRSAQPSLARRIRLTPAAPSAGGGAAPIHARARAVIRSR
jgi:hypothetical protein